MVPYRSKDASEVPQQQNGSGSVEVSKWAIGVVVTLVVTSFSGLGTGISLLVDLGTRVALAESELLHAVAQIQANSTALNTGPRYSSRDAARDRKQAEQRFTEGRQDTRELRSEIRAVRLESKSGDRHLENKIAEHANARAHVQAGHEISSNKEHIIDIKRSLREHDKLHKDMQ